MIPQTDADVNILDFNPVSMPSRAHNLGIINPRGGGFVDSREAMKQVIYLILNTERYEYPIYSWNYGAELDDLIGQPVPYVLPEIKRRVTEALLQDDRITAVDNWGFDVKRGRVTAAFTVYTIFGNIPAEKELKI